MMLLRSTNYCWRRELLAAVMAVRVVDRVYEVTPIVDGDPMVDDTSAVGRDKEKDIEV